MAFCKNTIDAMANSKTVVDNIYLSEYMPYLSTEANKCYLFGLFICQGGNAIENTLESFCKNIRLENSEVKKAFEELSGEGLIEVAYINDENFEVRFSAIRDVINNIKKYNKSKYSEFNTQIQNIIEGRMITPNEYAEYYSVIESLKLEPDALILIAKYCTNLKNKTIGHNYITTVAKNFAYQGARTVEEVNNKLMEQERSLGKIKELLSAMKIARIASMEEREMFLRWKKDYGFSENLIMFTQKMSKTKNFASLNKIFEHLNAMDIKSEREIEANLKTKELQKNLAGNIVKKLGLYYENLEPVVETYTSVWLNKGFEESFVENVAKMCFTQGIRTLEGMNAKLEQFFKKGIITDKALGQFSTEVLERDEKIKKVLDTAEIYREVNNFDRSMFNTWASSWSISLELILYAASLSKNATNAFGYINKILKSFKEDGISTVEEAKASNKKIESVAGSAKPSKKIEHNYDQHEYSKEKLNSVFANLDEVQNND